MVFIALHLPDGGIHLRHKVRNNTERRVVPVLPNNNGADWHVPRNIRQIPTQNTTIHVFIDSRVTFTIVPVHASPAPFSLSLAWPTLLAK